jgi:hypothetical protein
MDLRGVSIEGGIHHPPAHLQQQQQVAIMGKKRDPSLQTLDGVYQSLKVFAYRSLRQSLYPFLRLSMENWPRDESLGDVIELWLAYITPWTAFGESRFSDEWYACILSSIEQTNSKKTGPTMSETTFSFTRLF